MGGSTKLSAFTLSINLLKLALVSLGRRMPFYVICSFFVLAIFFPTVVLARNMLALSLKHFGQSQRNTIASAPVRIIHGCFMMHSLSKSQRSQDCASANRDSRDRSSIKKRTEKDTMFKSSHVMQRKRTTIKGNGARGRRTLVHRICPQEIYSITNQISSQRFKFGRCLRIENMEIGTIHAI